MKLTAYPGQHDVALPAVLVHQLDGNAYQLVTTLIAGTTSRAALRL